MAKQNFLNGGYIGKLGDTVGQRWKSERIIRTYVKPQNPNTPAQKTARSQFAIANKLAQEAMNINGHTGVWDTSSVPEYSQRVGQAMKRLRLGYSEADSLPLYPEGQSPAVGLVLQGVNYSPDTQIYTFQVNSFQIQNPTAATISFYTPLNYSNLAYNENVIHATVNSAANTFSVDLSTQNTQDGLDVKNLFHQAMQLGFCALKATFTDAIGAVLNNISITRKYQITNTLYDFDETTVISETSNKVTFTQQFSGNSISAAVSTQATSGFPLVTRISADFTFYDGLEAESLSSPFVTQTVDVPKITTLATRHVSGNIENVSAISYTLQAGVAQPKLYKDITVVAFPIPVNQAQITDISFAGNSLTINFGESVVQYGAASAEVTIGYFPGSKTGFTTKSTFTAAATINADDSSIALTHANIPNLGGGWLGELSISFKDNLGVEITALNPNKTTSVAGKYYYAVENSYGQLTTKARLVTGKAVGGNITGGSQVTASAPATPVYQNWFTIVYADGTEESLPAPSLIQDLSTLTQQTVYSAANTDKEIRSLYISTLAVNIGDTSGYNFSGLANFTVPTTYSLIDPYYSKNTFKLFASVDPDVISFVSSINIVTESWEDGIGWANDDPITAVITPGSGSIEATLAGNVGNTTEYGAPIFATGTFLYEDGSSCTTCTPSIISNSTVLNGAIAFKDSLNTISVESASITVLADGQFTITIIGPSSIINTPTYQRASSSFNDTSGDIILEFSTDLTRASADSLTGTADNVYITGSNIAMNNDRVMFAFQILNGEAVVICTEL